LARYTQRRQAEAVGRTVRCGAHLCDPRRRNCSCTCPVPFGKLQAFSASAELRECLVREEEGHLLLRKESPRSNSTQTAIVTLCARGPEFSVYYRNKNIYIYIYIIV
jgi:hypothetical protein